MTIYLYNTPYTSPSSSSTILSGKTTHHLAGNINQKKTASPRAFPDAMAPGPTPLVPKPQALRYRRGKLPTGAPIPSDSDDTDNSDDDEENDVSEKNRGRRAGGGRTGIKGEGQDGVVAGGAGRVIQTGSGSTAGAGGKRNIQVALRDVRVEEDGAVYVGGKREVGGGIEEEEEGEWIAWV